ncbi:MAG: beta-galactosidase trimerization domain-containing protein [Planctomycetes bacterium]|nr:beta-galactosidase trimerization domain-containing protein [Planctomycetota bacterium]
MKTLKLAYKRIILDYHYSEFLPETLSAVDPAEYVKQMAEAGIEAYLVYAKDHWGNVYHKTKISHKHPNAPEDLFGMQLELCRANGIIPYAYTTVCWDEHSARAHPEWRACGPDWLLMEKAPPQGSGWHYLCANSPYGDFFLQQLEELVAGYDFPALFLDIYHYDAGTCVCYCEHCRRKWRQMYGDDMPERMGVPEKVRYARFRDGFYREFYGQVNSLLSAHGKSDCLVTHNHGGTDPTLPSFIGKETEPFGLDYVIPQMVIKETRNRAAGRETEIYFGRFNQFWDFTVKSKQLLQWETVNVFAHDCAATIIDQPLLDGRLDKHAYAAIGAAYAEAGKLVKWTQGSLPYSEIGVYFDHLSYEVSASEGHDDFVGACKVLTECHLPFDLVTDFDHASKLDEFDAIVLPHTPLVGSKTREAIRQYVENGGVVICDYMAGIWNEAGGPSKGRHFLVDVFNHIPRKDNFIKPLLPVDATHLRTGLMLALTAKADDEVLGLCVPGALNRNQQAWVSHNTPPATEADGPAVVIRKLGKGRVLYFNTNIFSEYLNTNLKSLRDFIRLCIEKVYKARLWAKAPSIVDAIYQKKDGDVIVTLNCCTLDRGSNASSMLYGTVPPLHMNINETYPIAGIRLYSRQEIRQAEMLIEKGSPCRIGREDDLWYVELPAIEGYDAVKIKV